MIKRNLKAIETEKGIVIEMDYTYLYSLKIAINKAFKWGYRVGDEDYMDLLDIEEELNKIKGSWNE